MKVEYGGREPSIFLHKAGVEFMMVFMYWGAGKYLESKPKGMSQRDHKLLKCAWKTLTARLGSKHAQVAEE